MAETPTRPQAAQLVALGGRMVVGAVAWSLSLSAAVWCSVSPPS